MEHEHAPKPKRKLLVITGYIASTSSSIPTTLKRDGSDYSATIIARLLSAKSVTIWTDVSGIMSCDPRRVPSAKVLSEVSFNEAMELSYFGAKVLHPKCVQ
jgi:aspartokinase/homoserine dehydrogenase 1